MKKIAPIYAGVDACKAGWMMVKSVQETYAFGIWERIEDMIQENADIQRFLIDIPIGLGSESHPRTIDKKLRSELGKRSSTVFNAPVREAVFAKNYMEAKAKNLSIEGKSISIQSFNICPKIKETDAFLIQHNGVEIIESHPELCFKYLNSGEVVLSKKSSLEGAEERLAILRQYDSNIPKLFKKILSETKRKQAKKDDILDAICLCLVNRLAAKKLDFLTDENFTDEKGIEMKIAYYAP